MKDKGKALAWTALYIGAFFGLMFSMIFVMGVAIVQVAMAGGIFGNEQAMIEYMQKVQDIIQDGGNLMLLNGVMQIPPLAGFGLWYYFREKQYPFRPDYRRVFSAGNVWTIVGLGVFGQLAINLLMALIHIVLPGIFEKYSELIENFNLDNLPPLVMLFMVCLLGPLMEEVVFRGMIYGKLRRAFSFWPAALISAVVFGVFHMNLVQGIYATLFGVILAYIYEKTQTIWGNVLLHCVFNASSYLLEGLVKLLERMSVPELLSGMFLPALEVSGGVFVIFLLRRFRTPVRGLAGTSADALPEGGSGESEDKRIS